MSAQSPILLQAARFLNETTYDQLPIETVEIAKRAVLDYVGVAIPGSTQEVTKNLVQWAKKRSWGESASIIGSDLKMDVEHTALVNAAAGHALDFDDTSWATIGHPTTVILPALLAVSEDQGKSGKELLLAYITGVEVAHKVADLMMPEASEQGWHTTGIFYSFGTAAATCQLLQLDEEMTTRALALSLSRASGIRSNFGTQSKPYHAGMAAKAGLEAVSLAQAGITSSAMALEGQDGFIQCFAGDELANKARSLTESIKFGEEWDISTRGYAFKKYPNCSGNHPACDVILEFLNHNKIDSEDIESIDCGVSLLGPKELVSHQPKTPVEARFSLEFSLAAAFIYGQITLDEFTEEKIQNPRVQAFMQRITMEVDEDLAKLGFIGTAPIKIWITKKEGEKLFLENDLARGNHEKPFTDEEFIDKFCKCTKASMNTDQQNKLITMILNLEKLGSINDLFTVLHIER
ncbi:MmgE/PrpD family protein [Cocleimonas sp. KMM 6892]|uniref:MmgE/PrpD family protein n=1 Tax=unclassified Cocleimonas TaxID=2639732 RepID=UPI002DBD5630|nr:MULTISPECIES: MmgE/PrpD family protein [unclassified Cocleimonas]MEB8433403.1 MmgE/PrpD family protein [Cocleimonas sp. KMM 6892]MEC4716214.1 MmgE/PrpD family protein [Cocleimonas sp. KMM 6895]MEC4745893.1 MmgE/PrpD family protein [Cocleimonas sp. KMM 6896]